jgi:hypothetical protein
MKRFAILLAACLVGALAMTAPAGSGDPTAVQVSGTMSILALNLSNHRISAAMKGDLNALRRIRIVDSDIILTPAGFATLLRGRGSIITENGILLTRDRIVLKRITPGEPQRLWRGWHAIWGGLGEFAGYHGGLRTEGIIGPGADPLTYEGQLYPPDPDA